MDLRSISTAFLISSLLVGAQARAQIVDPSSYRGTLDAVVPGISDTNQVEIQFSNRGELVAPFVSPFVDVTNSWPRGLKDQHVEGLALYVLARVLGEKEKWASQYPDWTGRPDSTITVGNMRYADLGAHAGPTGEPWGWLPVPGFFNPDRIDTTTGFVSPIVASSDLPDTWPVFWPDRLSEADIGWPGRWNGLFGADSLIEGRETYYVMDDFSDARHLVDPVSQVPNSPEGVFYPDPADSTVGGLGLQVGVRSLAFVDRPLDDMTFYHVELVNAGGRTYDSLYVAFYIKLGLGWEKGDEMAEFDPETGLHLAFDYDGYGDYPMGGGVYPLGYVGLAMLGGSPGLTGTLLSTWPYFEAASNLTNDAWIWDRIRKSQFADNPGPVPPTVDVGPAWLLSSGPHAMAPSDSATVDLVLLFGENRQDLLRNFDNARQLADSLLGTDLVTGVESDHTIPDRNMLGANYPNPFNPTTTITYEIPIDSDLSLVVSDVLGRQVQVLESGRRAGGVHTVLFDASAMPSGVYFYTLTAGAYAETRTMVLLR